MVPTVRALIRQVFQHLLENAIKYRKADIKPEISLSASELDNHWEFRIKDNGIGIAPEFHEKIFSIFQRLHDNTEYSGPGMGLAIVKKIVETHGGEIRVESSEGAGSTFIFTLGKSLAGAASGSMTPANLNSRGTNSHGLKSYGSMPEDRNPGSPFNDTAASVSTKKSARHIPGSPGYSGNTQTNEPSAKNESTG
jgi:anti-sigma regulatory factor (Ser/Thr protein kinase)